MTALTNAIGPGRRRGGFLPIGDYAPIGGGRTVALVGSDGSIDWLCLPSFFDGSVFGALLDPERGGRFALAPASPHESRRRYLPGTNVLETTFTTAGGSVRVTDAITLASIGLLPNVELVRRVEGLSGTVPVAWSVEPRFGHGAETTRIERRAGVPVASAGEDAMAICAFDAGEPELTEGSVTGATRLAQGESMVVSLTAARAAPLIFPARDMLESRLRQTAELWRRWIGDCGYDGPWRDAVERSLLALKLLVYEPAGAMIAAPTTSLPERIGGERNFDYRLSWVRDSTFALDALLRLGMRADADRCFSWLLEATAHTHPRVQPIYELPGHPPRHGQTRLDVPGYRGSRPALRGNDAGSQEQLGNYGDLLETAWLYVSSGGLLDAAGGRRLAESADLLCDLWRTPDSGIWELPDRLHYTESKMACWTALDRACRLADAGQVPDLHAGRWRAEAGAIRAYLSDRCWSPERGAFLRHPDGDGLDASVLLGARMGVVDPAGERMGATIAAIRRELSAGGPLLYRYTGMEEAEGAFVACSFWLADALVRAGRRDEAGELIEAMTGLSNDVGLLSEEIDPASGELLGNFPQGLSHLALLNAVAVHEGHER